MESISSTARWTNISSAKMVDFTVRKFLSLPLFTQHKNCAELVRIIHEKIASGLPLEADLDTYRQMLGWMNELPLSETTRKSLSDRYHYHLNLAEVKHKEHNLLPHVRTQDNQQAAAPFPIAIYLDNIRSAHNVGSIVRTTEAFSLGTLYLSESTPSINHKQVKDAAMGADQWVQWHHNKKLDDLPRPIIALETSDDAVSIYEFSFPESFTLVIGNEEYGCSDETLRRADFIVEIPLRGRKNSLNVANAFAVAASSIVQNLT